VLEVELDAHDELVEIVGEPEDESLHGFEEIEPMEDDLSFAMVNCACCGSKDIEINGRQEVLSMHIRQ
jgi:hypothetical protein